MITVGAPKCLALFALLALCRLSAHAQAPSEWKQVIDRLERLESQNRALADEIRALRHELTARRDEPAREEPAAGKDASLEEKVAIQDSRIAEMAQTKVEASQHFPIRLTGMALFNTFLNTNQTEGSDYPTIVQPAGTSRGAGGTFRQTVIGLEYRGPTTPFGARVSGSVHMDFFGGSGQILGQEMRLRTASIQLDWKNSSITAGLEKPIFSPREPNSLAQVGVSPLTGAGNLWLWIPQVRFEHVLRFGGDNSGLRAQIGAVQTRESASYVVGSFEPELERTRPGLEGRFEFFHDFGNGRRLEVAPGFHTSTSHVAGTSVPSDLISVDWFASPWSKLQWSGTFFNGRNVGHFGTGGIRQGFTAVGPGRVDPVHSRGGWTQLTLLATNRLSFNLFSGQHDDRNRDLRPGRIGKNLAYGANFFYRLAPNVLVGMESSQVRTTYIGVGNRLNNHYDLALAYLF